MLKIMELNLTRPRVLTYMQTEESCMHLTRVKHMRCEPLSFNDTVNYEIIGKYFEKILFFCPPVM